MTKWDVKALALKKAKSLIDHHIYELAQEWKTRDVSKWSDDTHSTVLFTMGEVWAIKDSETGEWYPEKSEKQLQDAIWKYIQELKAVSDRLQRQIVTADDHRDRW